MFGSIEGTHGRISDKISMMSQIITGLFRVSSDISRFLAGKPKISKQIGSRLELLCLNVITDQLTTIETDYSLSVASVMVSYYDSRVSEGKNTENYYRIITSENFASRLNDAAADIRSAIYSLRDIILTPKLMTKADARSFEITLDEHTKTIERVRSIELNSLLVKQDYEVCKCGQRMLVVPELSELHCPDITCGKVRTIIGVVFRDDQFYPQEGQKPKHGGYDTRRHYKFWSERLQALESKTFREEDLTSIEYVIKRDRVDRKTITCEKMRAILKDPKVSATKLNDHVPLLVKTLGGPSPPYLTFQENKITSMRFNKAMRLYEIVNPNTAANPNKPYYPYFLGKIWEEMFKNDPDKLRILNYIHHQSRETVVKNDNHYKEICLLADPADGLVYRSTDPSRVYY